MICYIHIRYVQKYLIIYSMHSHLWTHNRILNRLCHPSLNLNKKLQPSYLLDNGVKMALKHHTCSFFYLANFQLWIYHKMKIVGLIFLGIIFSMHWHLWTHNRVFNIYIDSVTLLWILLWTYSMHWHLWTHNRVLNVYIDSVTLLWIYM